MRIADFICVGLSGRYMRFEWLSEKVKNQL